MTVKNLIFTFSIVIFDFCILIFKFIHNPTRPSNRIEPTLQLSSFLLDNSTLYINNRLPTGFYNRCEIKRIMLLPKNCTYCLSAKNHSVVVLQGQRIAINILTFGVKYD